MNSRLKNIYHFLLDRYGKQGWWPLIQHSNQNPLVKESARGYHPGNYDLPSSYDEIYEICLGAILTQNTGWTQVVVALNNLFQLNNLKPALMQKTEIDLIKEAIKPAGYFNQKARKIKIFTEYFVGLGCDKIPTRDELLSIWGVGPETADSMLLYAFKVPTFVVDAYTMRIFANLDFIRQNATYNEVKRLFEENLPKDLVIYQEYHALIVEHSKRFYRRGSDYRNCPIYQKRIKDEI